MTIRYFRIFLAVATHGSITKAAEELYLTQPTVSVAIREMEAYYGVKFFERISQRLKITEEGKAMVSYASHLINLYDEIENVFHDPDHSGKLRVGASVSVGCCFMPALVKRFKEHVAAIDLQVRVDSTEVLEKLLLENELDLVIAGGVFHSSFIKQTPLYDQQYMAVCHPAHRLANQGVSIADFLKEPLLFREPGSGAFEVFQRAASQVGYAVKPVWESSSMEVMIMAARAGVGVTILPREIAEQEMKAGLLAPIYFTDFEFQDTVLLAVHRNKYVSAAMKRFMELAGDK